MLRVGLTVHHKTFISDFVSAVDHATEELIVARLRAEAIVGEEGTSNARSGRIWYVDPVDGTYNFPSGLPTRRAPIALYDTLGAVYQPTTGELWTGGPSHPTTRNGAPVARLVDRPLAEVTRVKR